MSLEDKVKEGVQKGTGVRNFGARLGHFIKEIPSDVAYVVEMVMENAGYAMTTGHLPPPELEVALLGGTKVVNDYLVGEVLRNAFSKTRLSGGQLLKNYINGDLFPDLVEDVAIVWGASVATHMPAIYDPSTSMNLAAGLNQMGKTGLEVGAAALGAEAVSSVGIPLAGGIIDYSGRVVNFAGRGVRWVTDRVSNIIKWYDSHITGRRFGP